MSGREDTDRRDGQHDPGRPTAGLDDRLLALALGLDDDPALRAEVERSPELAGRLQAVERDVAAVADGLREVVPPEPQGWADLSHERWAGLRPFVHVAAGGRQRPAERRPFWRRWQAVVPAVAAVLVAAVVLGVVAGRDALRTSDGGFGTALTEKGADTGSPATGGGAAPTDAGATPEVIVSGADEFGAVVVAVAGPLDGAEQSFRVERVLKGTAADTVRLQTEVGSELAPGSRVLLFLDPVGELAQAQAPTVSAQQSYRAGGAPDATPGTGEADQGGGPGDEAAGSGQAAVLKPAPGLFLRNGETAVVVPLPGGTRPERVILH